MSAAENRRQKEREDGCASGSLRTSLLQLLLLEAAVAPDNRLKSSLQHLNFFTEHPDIHTQTKTLMQMLKETHHHTHVHTMVAILTVSQLYLTVRSKMNSYHCAHHTEDITEEQKNRGAERYSLERNTIGLKVVNKRTKIEKEKRNYETEDKYSWKRK